MGIYLLSCLGSTTLESLASFLRRIDTKRKQGGLTLAALLVACSFCIPLFITGLRDVSVGIDTQSYFNNFIETRMGWRGTMEYGYYLLNVVCIEIGLGPTGFFLVCSAIFLGFTYAAIHRFSPSPSLSVFLLFTMGHLFYFMNIMRQMMAAAILLYSIRFVIDRRPAPFLTLVLAASSIHGASVIFLIVYIAPLVRMSPVPIALAALFVACFSAQISSLLMWVASLTKYGVYFDANEWQVDTAGIVGNLRNLVVLFFGLYGYSQMSSKSTCYSTLLVLQILAVFSGLVASSFSMMGRFQYTFGLGSVILLPKALQAISDKRVRLLFSMVIVALYFLYAIYAFGLVDSMGTLPYELTAEPIFW